MQKTVTLKFPLKGKYVALLAPSFIVDFDYPEIISGLKQLGFQKVVELTFAAKMVNREYHKILKDSDGLKIASVCPGVIDIIGRNYPEYKKNLIKVDSPRWLQWEKLLKKNILGLNWFLFLLAIIKR
jgi:iron only hydrogenase large subunit-like protein